MNTRVDKSNKPDTPARDRGQRLANQAAWKLPCQNRENPDLWFSSIPTELDHAKALCQHCPVRNQCLTAALERAEPCGVWGGHILQNGTIIAHKRTAGRPRKNTPTETAR